MHNLERHKIKRGNIDKTQRNSKKTSNTIRNNFKNKHTKETYRITLDYEYLNKNQSSS